MQNLVHAKMARISTTFFPPFFFAPLFFTLVPQQRAPPVFSLQLRRSGAVAPKVVQVPCTANESTKGMLALKSIREAVKT